MKNNDFEKKFDAACGNISLKEPRDLWPGVSMGIKERRKHGRPARTLWTVGFSAAAVLLILSIPGASESIGNVLRRMFSTDYSVQIGESAPENGVLISVDGEVKVIRAGDMLLEVRVTSMDEKAAKIELSVFQTGIQSDGPDRKLLAKPTVVVMKGKKAEIIVADKGGKQMFKFIMTPTENIPDGYTGTLNPIKSEALGQLTDPGSAFIPDSARK